MKGETAPLEALIDWRGATAMVWLYRISLKTVCLMLSFSERDEVACLVGTTCSHLQGPLEWHDARVEVLQLRKGTRVASNVIVDPTAGFSAFCDIENIHLIPRSDLAKFREMMLWPVTT